VTAVTRPAGRLAAYTYEEYRRFEDTNPARHEYVDGQILAMAGGTPAHARLQAAVLFALERRLEGRPCQPFPSDLRVKVVATGVATYPGVTVVCGSVETDAGDKFEHYRQIPTLQAYVLVSHRERRIETRRRAPDGGWSEHVAGRGQTAALEAIGTELAVDEIYDRSPLTREL